MLLYLSSTIPYEIFNDLLNTNDISSGHQAQKFNNLLITGLSKHKEIFAVSNPPYQCKRDIPLRKFKDNKINYIIVPCKKSRITQKITNFLNLFKESANIIKNNQISYIISDSINFGANVTTYLLSKIKKIPIIAIVTDVHEIMCKGKMNLFNRIGAFIMKRYDGYVLLTEQMNSIVNPGDKPFIVIEGSCDFTEKKEEKIINKQSNVCLYSGSLSKNTGIELMIEAFIKSNIKDAELHIYGSGELSSEIKNISDNHNNIVYFGSVTNAEIIERQKEATLLINPRPLNISYGAYSFPSKLIEYMASGTPVLSTKLPGIPEEYLKYLYLIEDETVEGFSEILISILNSNNDELNIKGYNAKRFVLDNKNNYKQAERIIEFCEIVLSNIK